MPRLCTICAHPDRPTIDEATVRAKVHAEIRESAWALSEKLFSRAKKMLEYPMLRQTTTRVETGPDGIIHRHITIEPVGWRMVDVCPLVMTASSLGRLAAGMDDGTDAEARVAREWGRALAQLQSDLAPEAFDAVLTSLSKVQGCQIRGISRWRSKSVGAKELPTAPHRPEEGEAVSPLKTAGAETDFPGPSAKQRPYADSKPDDRNPAIVFLPCPALPLTQAAQ